MKPSVQLCCGAFLLSIPVLGTPFTLPPPCVEGTLADYLELEPAGCSIGRLGYSDFAFDVLSAVDTDPANASQIRVSPLFHFPVASLNIESASFSVAGTQSVSYLIRYVVDPHPEIFGIGVEMITETPVAPGEAVINVNACIGAIFDGDTCGGSVEALEVFHRGTTSQLIDTADFPLTALIDVRTTITLNANGASADIQGLMSNTRAISQIPEPSTWLLLVSAAALGVLRQVTWTRTPNTACGV